jgi:AraC-like DNA-binding protein
MHGRSSEPGPEPTDRPQDDALSEVLLDLRLSGVGYGRCELTRPWGLEFADQTAARFHFIVEGGCWLNQSHVGWIELRAGDVVLLPRGRYHRLSDSVDRATKPIESVAQIEIGERLYDLREGGRGSRDLLACCSVEFEAPAVHPLFELMPPVLLVRGGASEDAVLPVLLDAMADEVRRRRVGAATVTTRLADVVIARVIRAWVESHRDATGGWLAAIRDPHIGRALAEIHRRPGAPWSVESLADVAGSSRSMFSERFAALVGMPPARYLARWRMHLASVWLRRDGITVAEAAVRLGYESEAAFSRAFKRFAGVPPSSLRAARDGDAH